jgi:hypothetical protein
MAKFDPDAYLASQNFDPDAYLGKKQTYDPTEGMTTAQKFLAGIGKAFVDVGRGGGQLLGIVSREDIQRARELDAPLMRTGAGTAGNIIGNVAMLAPTAMIPGANTATGAATIGAISGLMQPSTSTGETLTNIGIGGLSGAAVPLATQTYRGAKSLAEPFYQAGREKIVGRAITKAAGGDDAINVISALRGATAQTPGVQPTVAMAAQQLNRPSLAALGRATEAVNPDVMNAIAARNVSNQQAMRAAIESVTPDQALAMQARQNVAGALYNQARTQGIDQAAADSLQPQIQSLVKRLPSDVVESAKDLARISGIQIDDVGSVQGLHWVKESLDDQISAAARSGNSTRERALMGLKENFLDTLDQLSPTYAQARQTYAKMSQPVNQAQVLGRIGERAATPQGDMTFTRLANAATDRTAQSVTGMPRATLESTLTPQQMATINALRGDLGAMNWAQTAGRGAGSDTVQKLAFTNMLQQVGIPTFLQNFAPSQIVGNLAQRGLGLAYGEMNQRLSQELAEAMMNPQKAAELMQFAQGNPQIQKLLSNALRSSAVIGASVPAITQGQQ